MYENIAENLKYLRSTRVPMYSQREIAGKLHVSRSTYGRYERGELIPPLWFLHVAALFYGIEVSVLMSKELKEGNEEKECKDEE